MTAHEHEDDAISDIEGSSLFSDGDSEMIDSPTDGYFMQRSHPQQFYVQNGSTTKRHEATRSPVSSQQALHSPQSSQPLEWATEDTPLLDAGPAPPDYYAATADRRTNNRDQMSYGSTSEEHGGDTPTRTPRVLLQAGLFGSDRAPQSMNDVIHDEESQTLMVMRHKPKLSWRKRIRSRRRSCLGVLLGLATIAVVVIFALRGLHKSEDTSSPQLPEATPTPTKPEHGDKKPSDPQNRLPITSQLPGCSYGTFHDSWQYDFKDVSNFTFEEAITTSDYNLGGTVWVRPAPQDQEPAIRVTLSFVTSSGLKIEKLQPVLSHDSIRIVAPMIDGTSQSGQRACVDVGIAIDVRKDLALDHWTTQTSSFNIYVLNGLFESLLTSKEKSCDVSFGELITASGTVNAKYWSSRRTIVKSTYGSVYGKYALRDLLAIETISGSVVIDVDPKEADKDKPLPAVFKVSSVHGSIKAAFPVTDDLPDRDYETTIESISGSVAGSYVHGKTTDFQSKSGSITGTLLPYHGNQSSSISTTSVSGSVSLQILSPYDGELLSRMRSKHDSSRGSGSMHLRYPDEWRGHFSAKSVTGSIYVHGHDVELDWSSFFGFFGDKKITGRKGTGDSYIEVTTTSGSTNMVLGSE